ncbi:MAG: HAMP domain-containing histidine kinase, partial [Actinobacteria bacterium]|nr:HAMP domain-containing histidine kinase [Actinomycetota bacterium]
DVTDRVTAEVEMVRMVRMRDQLIAAVSHELRTPLTSVIGLLEVLRETTTADQGSEERTLLDLAAAEAASLGFLVEDLLVAARRGFGKVPVKAVPIPIGEIVRDTIEHLSWSSAGEVRFDIDVPGDLEAVGDPVRVGQILRNLLVNSIRYGGERRRVSGAVDGPELVVRVIDDGPGVGPGMIGSLFEPYRNAQLHPTMPGSLGLGLTISWTLAVAMGGDLSYYRREGETVFELRLPVALCPVLHLVDGGSGMQGASVPAAYPWAGPAVAASGGWGGFCETFRDEGGRGPVIDPFPVLDPFPAIDQVVVLDPILDQEFASGS